MRALMCRAVVVAGAVVVLLGPAAGVASAAGGAVAGTRLAAGAGAVFGGAWGTAEEVPGTAALNQEGNAAIDSVSCAGAGACSAGGSYLDSSGFAQAWVVSTVTSCAQVSRSRAATVAGAPAAQQIRRGSARRSPQRP